MPALRPILVTTAAASLAALLGAGPALACAGLVTPGGNVRLLRTATLAAWHDGLEHYVTSFTFSGGGAEVGSIVPLPGVPSKVERGGDWTLQRLERETQPPPPARAEAVSASPDSAEVVYETRIDALDITILKGGGPAVGQWASDHGFSLTPDAPEVLDFYAARSPVFMAARFDAQAARERGQEEGEGTPIHLTIPLDEPWVPLRVLGLGRPAEELVEADVYLLTPARPTLLPAPGEALQPLYDSPASQSLLDDLRSDKGMEWVPTQAWLTYLRISAESSRLNYDLAIDAAGDGQPSRVAAGLEAPPPAQPATTTTTAPATTSTTRPRPAPTTTTAPPPTTVTTQAEATGQTTTGAEVPDGDLDVEVAEAGPLAAPVGETPTGARREVSLPDRSTPGRRGPVALLAASAGALLGGGAAALGIRRRTRRAR